MAFLIIRDIIPFFKKIGRWERLTEHPLMPSDSPVWTEKVRWSIRTWDLTLSKQRFKSWSVTCQLNNSGRIQRV